MGYSLGGVMFVLLVYDIVIFGVNCYGEDVEIKDF